MAITATVTGGAVQLTGNPVFVNCAGASIPAGASEYMILLKILSPDTKLEGAPLTDAIIPDANGASVFDISGILDQPYEVTFQYPVTQKYIAHPTQAFNVQVQPGERYISSQGLLVENWFALSDVFQMIKGGLSPRQNAMMKAIGETYYSKYIQGGKFLTPRPWGDFVHPNQPVKLWFMPDSNNSSTLAIAGYYSDGSSETKSTSIFLNTDYLYELNLNPVLHGLTLEPAYNKKLLYFDVWLHYNGSALSDVRRFEIDWRHCERPYFLLFANSLGGIDDVYFNGFGIDQFSVEGSLAYRPVRPADTVFTPTILSSNKTARNKWKINSGWKSNSTIQFYRDLMLSKQAWFMYSNSGTTNFIVVPVIIENFDGPIIDRQEDQWNIDIEFTEAHTSRFSFDNRSF
jgi:hypothetical protein